MKTLSLLSHMRESAELILERTGETSLQRYLRDRDLQQIVERNFEIIGEAMRRLTRHDAAIADRITDGREIIAFRNLLIHAYDDIDHARVWQVVQRQLPVLVRELDEIVQSVKLDDREPESS
ncbi:MAG: DUF86 domain-containing protein [Chloroflexota bacterium]|nr:DUF86 domain-containing protein [Chloroflexota bacterium]